MCSNFLGMKNEVTWLEKSYKENKKININIPKYKKEFFVVIF